MSTYVETLADLLKGKLVELYLGDEFERVTYADNSKGVPSVLIGEIIQAKGDCLMLDSMYYNKSDKKYIPGNIIYVNGYNIVAVCEINGNGTLLNALQSVTDSSDYHVPNK